MLVCDYCGRNFKNEYEKCPGCGAGKFHHTNDTGVVVIDKPPADGYNVNLDNYKKMHKAAELMKWFGVAFIVIDVLGLLPFLVFGFFTIFVDFTISIAVVGFEILFLVLSLGVPILFIVLSKMYSDKAKNEMERVTKLSKTGMLIKNLPYKLVASGSNDSGQVYTKIEVEFDDGKGFKKTLSSGIRYDGVIASSEKSADLLIDENDYSNYFIDFEIY